MIPSFTVTDSKVSPCLLYPEDRDSTVDLERVDERGNQADLSHPRPGNGEMMPKNNIDDPSEPN